MHYRKKAVLFTRALALALALLTPLAACARVDAPNVYPPETEAPAEEETPAPEVTPVPDPINRTGSGISTRAPLATFTPLPTPSYGLLDPEEQARYAAYAAPGYGYGTSATAQQTVGAARGSGTIRYDEPVPGDARGSLPGLQPVRMKAVWVATVLNIDFPQAVGDAEAQKKELLEILDNTRRWELDTVFFQVRPSGDALYRSEINPWSHYLTGERGKDPGWDPLAFMTEEAHRRGLSLHVWLNPYRVGHSSEKIGISDLPQDSFAAQHPQWVISYEGGLYLDPAVPEVRQHIADTVREIVENYNVDGVHFDDYFYPSGYPLPPGAEQDGIIARERRENVTAMIRLVHDTIRSCSDRVVFGVSPFGIWKNSSTDPEGSDTQGGESYYDQAADSLAWVRQKIIDYIAPQLYWPIGYEAADYRKLTDWWSSKLQGSGVSLIIGQGVYQDEIAGEITAELAINQSHSEITGSIFFSYQNLRDNPACAEAVRKFYSE